jgi:hypothetical protein
MHWSASEKMAMDMKYGLTRNLVAIKNETVSFEFHVFSNIGGGEGKITDYVMIGISDIVESGDMGSRNNQNVNGCLRVNVMEREYVIGFEDDFRGNLFAGDFAE